MFYKLLPLNDGEKAVHYLAAVKTQLEKDGLWDMMKVRLISIVSDGASVLTGEINGFGVLMRNALQRPTLYVHHCLSHRSNYCD